MFLGSLSDVVKGVKSGGVPARLGGGGVGEEGDEIVVSAEYGESSAYVVSAASPTPELEMGGKGGKGGEPSSQTQTPLPLSPNNNPTKKYREFREVGVGSADDNHDIRASTSK